LIDCSVVLHVSGLILDEVSLNENSILNLKAGSKKQADWNVVGKFDAMSYWNWDKIPSDGDVMPQLLQWARLAEAVSYHFRVSSQPLQFAIVVVI
jgi:hypothetical protein